MANPNNCSTCDHNQHPDGGHCYMLRHEPQDVYMQHTGRKRSFFSFVEVVSEPKPRETPGPTPSEAVPEMRDALLDLVATLGKHHPGGLLPEVAHAFTKARALVERIAPVRLPGAWERLEGTENLYVKTYATPGVWIEAHLTGSRISLRAKREILLGGIMKAAIEVDRANVHACDRIQIDAAIRQLEQRLDEALCSAKESDHA